MAGKIQKQTLLIGVPTPISGLSETFKQTHKQIALPVTNCYRNHAVTYNILWKTVSSRSILEVMYSKLRDAPLINHNVKPQYLWESF